MAPYGPMPAQGAVDAGRRPGDAPGSGVSWPLQQKQHKSSSHMEETAGPLWLCDACVLQRSRWKGLSWVPLAAP